MPMAGVGIRNLKIRTFAEDPENFIAEAGIDARHDLVAVAFCRYRGLRHTDDGDIVVRISEDRGQTWDMARETVALPRHKHWGYTMAAVNILRDGTILVTGYANRLDELKSVPERYMGPYVVRSDDRGRTWTDPEPVLGTWPLRRCATRAGMVEMPDGGLILPVHGSLHTASRQTYVEATRSAVLRSNDKGENWFYLGTIGFDPAGIHHMIEPGVTLLPDGRLIALMRHQYETCRETPPGGNLFFAESEDGGVMWSPLKRTGIWGYPASPIPLKDGRALCVYGHRRDPLSIKVALSNDGRTWKEEQTGILYLAPNFNDGEATGSTINRSYRHIGYPACTVLEEGTVLAVFHAFDSARKQVVMLASFVVA